jgi:hypothetical protein
MIISRLRAAILATLFFSSPAFAQQSLVSGNYVLCTLHPQSPLCASVYREALTQTGPIAGAVKNAYAGYAKYVEAGGAGLTDQDRQYLADNGMRVPADLAAADQAGLHNVIHDPALKTDRARKAAINNFLSRAVQAELYCSFNACPAENRPLLAGGGAGPES